MASPFIKGTVEVELITSKVREELAELNSLVTKTLKEIGATPLKIDITLPTGLSGELSTLAPSLSAVSKELTLFNKAMSGLSAVNAAKLKNIASTLSQIDSIKLPQITGGADFGTFAKSVGMLGKIDSGKIANELTGIANAIGQIKFNITPQQVALLERFANALQLLKNVSPNARLYSNLQKINQQLAKQVSQQEKINQQQKQSQDILGRIGGGIVGMVKDFGQMIVQQATYAAVWTVIFGTIQGIKNTIREGVDLFKELDKGVGRVLATGLSAEQAQNAFTEMLGPDAIKGGKEYTDSLRQIVQLQALAFSTKYSASLEEYTNAMYELVSANIEMGNALDFTDTSMKLALATQADIQETTRSMAGLYNIFGDTIKDVSTEQEKFQQISNVVLYTWSKEQMELTELNTALKYSGNVARLAGVDYKLLVTMIGHLNTYLIRSSTAGTGFRAFLAESGKDIKGVADLAMQLGPDLDEVKTKFNLAFNPNAPADVLGVLKVLRERVIDYAKDTGESGEKIKLTLGQIGKFMEAYGLRAGNVVAQLVLTLPELEKKYKNVLDLQDDYIDSFVRLNQLNVSDQFNILTRNLKLVPAAFLLGMEHGKDFAIALESINAGFEAIIQTIYKWGMSFSKYWGDAADLIAENQPIIDEVISEFFEWGKILGETVVNIIGLVSVLSPVLSLLNDFLKIIISLSNALVAFGLIVANVFTSFGEIIIAAVRLIADSIGSVIEYLQQAGQLMRMQKENFDNFLLGKKQHYSYSTLKGFFEDMNDQWDKSSIFAEASFEDALNNIAKKGRFTFKLLGENFWDSLGSLAGASGADQFSITLESLKDKFFGLSTIPKDILDAIIKTSRGSEAEMERVNNFMRAFGQEFVEFDINSKKFEEDLDGIIRTIQDEAMMAASTDLASGISVLVDGMQKAYKGVRVAYAGESPFIKEMANAEKFRGALTNLTEEYNATLYKLYKKAADMPDWLPGAGENTKKGLGWLGLELTPEAVAEGKKAYHDLGNEINRVLREMGEAADTGFYKIQKLLDFPGMSEDQKELTILKFNQAEEEKGIEDLLNYYEEKFPERIQEVQVLADNLRLDHARETADLLKKQEEEMTAFFGTEEEKKIAEAKSKADEFLKVHGDTAENRYKVEKWLKEETIKIHDEELESTKKTAEQKVEAEKKAAEAIQKIREELLKDAQEKAEAELGIQKQKKIQELTQAALLSMQGASASQIEAIQKRYEIEMKILEGQYGIREAQQDQQIAQQNIMQNAKKILQLEQEIKKTKEEISREKDPVKKKELEVTLQEQIAEKSNLITENAKEELAFQTAKTTELTSQYKTTADIIGMSPEEKGYAQQYYQGESPSGPSMVSSGINAFVQGLVGGANKYSTPGITTGVSDMFTGVNKAMPLIGKPPGITGQSFRPGTTPTGGPILPKETLLPMAWDLWNLLRIEVDNLMTKQKTVGLSEEETAMLAQKSQMLRDAKLTTEGNQFITDFQKQGPSFVPPAAGQSFKPGGIKSDASMIMYVNLNGKDQSTGVPVETKNAGDAFAREIFKFARIRGLK